MSAIDSTWAGPAWPWRRSTGRPSGSIRPTASGQPGFGAMEAALRDQPDDSPLRSELDNARIDVADKLLQLGLWEEAGELLDRVFRRNPAKPGSRQTASPGTSTLCCASWPAIQPASAPVARSSSSNSAAKENKSNLYRACLAGTRSIASPRPEIPGRDGGKGPRAQPQEQLVPPLRRDDSGPSGRPPPRPGAARPGPPRVFPRH